MPRPTAPMPAIEIKSEPSEAGETPESQPLRCPGPALKGRAYWDSILEVEPERIFTTAPEDQAAAKAAMERDGVIIVRIEGFGPTACREAVWEQFTRIITQQPWDERHQIRIPDKSRPGSYLDINNLSHREAIIDVLMAPLTPQLRKHFSDCWVLHRQFGACCDDASFWTYWQCWLRDHRKLSELAAELIGRPDICCDINRSIQKLPGEGMEAFLHWDWDPRTFQVT